MAGKSLRQAFLQIFMDLTEYVSAGYNPNDITVSIIYSAAPTAKFQNQYFMTHPKHILLRNRSLRYQDIPGSNSDHQKETQFRIQPPAGAPWDNTNDFSYQGIKKNGEVVKEMPVYEDGVLIFGVEPNGTGPATPTPKPSVNPSPSPTPTSDILYGDINLDGKINSSDVTLLKRYIVKSIDVFPTADPERSLIASDVNGDGRVNSTDYSYLKRYVLKIIPTIPGNS